MEAPRHPISRTLVGLAVSAILAAGACGSGPPPTPPPSASSIGSASTTPARPAVGPSAVTSAAAGTNPSAAPSRRAPRATGRPSLPSLPPLPPPSVPATAVPVPSDLEPPLADAAKDQPIVYTNGCHLGMRAVDPPRCTFGDPNGTRTVVLMGDSIAAQWFPAIDAVARSAGWRLVSLTKSACTAVSVAVWSVALGREYRECDQWRQNVLARIAATHPQLVVVSDDRLYQLAVNGGPVPVARRRDLWDAGLVTTLRAIRKAAGAVVLLGSTPRSRFPVPACLAAHLADARACATAARSAIDPTRIAADEQAAAAAGARYVDPSRWICPADPCPALTGNLLIYREQDHLTAAFVLSLAATLAAAIGMT